MAKHISIVEILKQSGKFNLVNAITNVLSIPKTIIIAMVLTPRDYGIISFLGLWSMYAGFINPGFLSARNREMAHELGKDDKEKALRIQNISHTADLIYSILPFMIIFSASFFFSDRIIKIGFMLTALTYAVTHIVTYWRGVNFVRQNFNVVAKADLIQAVSIMLTILALIFWIRIYAILIAPIMGGLFASLYYSMKGRIGYQFIFDWPQAKRLFRIGISFSILSLLYWGYRFIDRTVIATFLPLEELGIYAYAASYIFLGISFLSDFGNVLSPILWTKAGHSDNRGEVFFDTKRIVVYLSVITAIMISLSQIGFYFLVKFLTKKYLASIPVFILLSSNLYLTSLAIVPSLILQSAVVNKQALSSKVYTIGLALNIALDIAAIYLGYGIIGIALINVVIQSIVTFAHFYLVRSYIFNRKQEFPAFILFLGLPFFISIGFSIFHIYLLSRINNPYFLGLISLLVQAAVWFTAINLFYRKYFSRDKVDKIIKIFLEFIFKVWRNFLKTVKLYNVSFRIDRATRI